jgi:uncharacterized membrane protein
MAFCAKCGSPLSGGAAFCASCGAPVGAQPPGPTPPLTTPAPITSNVAGALCYLAGFVTGIIFLVIEPYRRDSFVRFHAFQSIFLSAAVMIIWIVWGAVFGALFFASLGLLWSFLGLIWTLLRIAFFIIWLLMMYKAYNNERYMLPWIGPLAAKQAGA